jgi:predicted RNA-binding protein Jag
VTQVLKLNGAFGCCKKLPRIQITTKEALQKFRSDFKPTVTSKGAYFNIRLFVQVVQILCRYLNIWNSNQSQLFLYQVLKHIEVLLPACDKNLKTLEYLTMEGYIEQKLQSLSSLKLDCENYLNAREKLINNK